MEITTNVGFPTVETKVCTKCGANKEVSQFSLLRGKHSGDRKKVCVECEGKTKKARKLYDMTMEEMDKFLALPCFVCGQQSEKIQLNENSVPIASLCSLCYSFGKMHQENPELILAAYNHAIFVRDFPFWLKHQIKSAKTPKPTPLLDIIDEAPTKT